MIKIFVLVTKKEREILRTKTYTNKIHNVLTTKSRREREKEILTENILDVLSVCFWALRLIFKPLLLSVTLTTSSNLQDCL